MAKSLYTRKELGKIKKTFETMIKNDVPIKDVNKYKREVAKMFEKESYNALAKRANDRIYDIRKAGLEGTMAWNSIQSKLKTAGREGMKTFPTGKNVENEADLKNLVIGVLTMPGSYVSILKNAVEEGRRKGREVLGEVMSDEMIDKYYELWKNADIKSYLSRFSSETDTQEINRWDVLEKMNILDMDEQDMMEQFLKAQKASENDKQFKQIINTMLDEKIKQKFDENNPLTDYVF